jgi:hypothetical protein
MDFPVLRLRQVAKGLPAGQESFVNEVMLSEYQELESFVSRSCTGSIQTYEPWWLLKYSLSTYVL